MINYNRLWTLISEYNLTKTEFMNQLGVSSATFAKLSSNQPVTMEVLEKICNILGCSLDNIVSFDPDVKSPVRWGGVDKTTTYLIKLYYIVNKKTEDPEAAAACDIEYLYGYSYPFNMTIGGLNTWEISYFHDFNDIIEVNGYCIGATLLNILKHLEKNPVLSEITEKNDITLKCNGCTDDIKNNIDLLPFFYKLPEYRPAYLLEASDHASNLISDVRPQISINDMTMQCESFVSENIQGLLLQHVAKDPAHILYLHKFLKKIYRNASIHDLARLGNFEVLSYLHKPTMSDNGLDFEINTKKEPKNGEITAESLTLTLDHNIFEGRYGMLLRICNTHNCFFEHLEMVNVEKDDYTYLLPLQENVSTVEIRLYKTNEDATKTNLIAAENATLIRSIEISMHLEEQRFTLEDSWTQKMKKQTKVKDTSLSQGTFSSSNTFSIGDNANELWYQNETMVSKTCSCIINQNVQNNEGIFFEKGNDEHRRFLKWLGDTLSKHPCYEIIIIDPYINDTALGKIIRNIQSPHVAYTIFTNDDKERIASIKRLEKPKEILGLSELNVYVLPADTLHDRYIILRCKDTPIPNVYSMTNSLDNEAQKHSSLIVSLNNRLCIAVDEYYCKLITELQKNNNVTNVFEIEKTAAPNASQENNTSQFVEEKPFQPIATKEEYITLCNNDLSGALEQLAYITPGKLYDDCVAHIHKLDNIEDKLATILKHYQSTPYKNAIKLSQRDSYEERQFLSIAQIFTKQMDFKLSLIDSADNFINYYFDYRFFNESWTIKFAVELLCQIAPVKAIDCLNELYQSLLSEDNRVPQPSNTQRLAAMLITNLTDLLCSSKNNKAITKSMLECDVPFLRAIAIAYSCRNFTTSKKVNVPVILRKLCSNLSVKEQLLTLIYAIKELQTRYFRKNGLYEETQKQIDDVIKIFAAIITESNISDVIGNDDLFKTLHTLSTQNVEDVCKIYDTLVKRGVITNTVAGKYLMELVTEPYKNGVENKKSFYDQIKTIKNSLIILSYIHELDTGSFKTVMKRFKNYEFEFTKPLYSATLKEQNYNLWKNHIDFLGCLVYIELWAQKNYQHKLSKAVNEYKMISSNYSKILMKYSTVYQVIVNELSASKL